MVKEFYYMPLSNLQVGAVAVIEAIEVDTDIKHRLLQMGIMEGSKIKALYKCPFGRMIAYKIKNTVIGVRDIHAEKIFVTVIGGE